MEIPIVRTIVYWGLYWGPLLFGNYHLATAARINKIISLNPPCTSWETLIKWLWSISHWGSVYSTEEFRDSGVPRMRLQARIKSVTSSRNMSQPVMCLLAMRSSTFWSHSAWSVWESCREISRRPLSIASYESQLPNAKIRDVGLLFLEVPPKESSARRIIYSPTPNIKPNPKFPNALYSQYIMTLEGEFNVGGGDYQPLRGLSIVGTRPEGSLPQFKRTRLMLESLLPKP